MKLLAVHISAYMASHVFRTQSDWRASTRIGAGEQRRHSLGGGQLLGISEHYYTPV